MLRIEQTYLINATPEEIWQALTDAALMGKWSDQPAEFDARVGGDYKLFGEYVTGRVVEYAPPRRLAQTWKPVDWTITDSIVTFTLQPTDEGTQVDLLHENVQPEDFEGTSKGWDEFCVGALKKMLEAKPKKKRAPAKKAAVIKRTAAKKKPAAKKKTVAKKTTTARRSTRKSK